MYRLFIAIDFNEDIREMLSDICFGLRQIRWSPLEQLHLTLRFLGDVDKHTFEDILSTLARVEAPAFSLTIKGAGYFPPRRSPRIIWAGVEPDQELLTLKNKIDRVLQLLHVEPDKHKFHPHITLGRAKGEISKHSVMPFITRNALFKIEHLPVTAFHLYSSQLTREGAVHTCEATYDLDQRWA
ncbi:MAG: RNA 2',3'-cyclic phosphodiesterase [Chitinivibrionales bacterium]|nr:RNA 2',3'-cyclic phosphodiesterase [Chitinivibrionales bacterium]